uniref:Erythema protein SVEP-6 n=1 Tax=Simulium nigrimanum TaxID=683695 RepID=D1FPV9_SIMNI
MTVLSGLIVLIVAGFGATTAQLIADGSCIIIMDGDQVIHERKPGQVWAHYLFMVTKDKEYDDQRWILQRTCDDYYKLKNKHSNRYMIIGSLGNMITDAKAGRDMDAFKFVPVEKDLYDIVNNKNKHPSRNWNNSYLKWSSSQQKFTIKKCT